MFSKKRNFQIEISHHVMRNRRSPQSPSSVTPIILSGFKFRSKPRARVSSWKIKWQLKISRLREKICWEIGISSHQYFHFFSQFLHGNDLVLSRIRTWIAFFFYFWFTQQRISASTSFQTSLAMFLNMGFSFSFVFEFSNQVWAI